MASIYRRAGLSNKKRDPPKPSLFREGVITEKLTKIIGTMNRDDFAKMKVRQDIAKAFIEKLEKVDTKDVGLIPALMDYIESGNKKMFDEYNEFHFMLDTQAKKERLQDTQKLVETIEEVEKQNEDYRKAYDQWVKEYQEWRLKQMKAINDGTEFQDHLWVRDLCNFLEEYREKDEYFGQRKLYVKVEDKILRVDSITLTDSNKAILEVNNDTLAFVCPAPKEPNVGLSQQIFISRRIKSGNYEF
jgi:hypothetical protein